jgi:hypothetical protein
MGRQLTRKEMIFLGHQPNTAHDRWGMGRSWRLEHSKVIFWATQFTEDIFSHERRESNDEAHLLARFCYILTVTETSSLNDLTRNLQVQPFMSILPSLIGFSAPVAI